MKTSTSLAVAGLFGGAALAQDTPPPTVADLAYGDHPRQVLDFYRAESDAPTPFVFFIHGGGWNALDKSKVHSLLDVPRLLENGISIVAINYRYANQARQNGVVPPVKAPLEDAARALQFARTKAAEWNLEKEKAAASGGSAGGCSSLWLAFHDDLARPESDDPVARESTRLAGAAVAGAQTSLDPRINLEWMPDLTYGAHAFGFPTAGKDKEKAPEMYASFAAQRDSVAEFIREYSPLEHVSADDPPVWLTYTNEEPLTKGMKTKDPTHSALFGLLLMEKAESVGASVTVTYPGAPVGPHANPTDALIGILKP